MADFVTDASATLPWCFADEATPWTEALLNRLQSGDLREAARAEGATLVEEA